MATGEARRPKWDASKERELFAAKVQNAEKNEGYTIRLVSYDGGEAKLDIIRSYKLDNPTDGKPWRKELPKDGRIKHRKMPWYLLAELFRLRDQINEAKAKADGNRAGGKDDDGDDSF